MIAVVSEVALEMTLIKFRAPVLEDAPAVLAVLAARDIADLGVPDCTLEDLHDEWRGSDFDLAADALVAEDDGGVILGYAVIVGPGAHADVAPDQEGRGIGTRLLKWAEDRDRERGRERHRQWVAASNERGRALLLAAGYQPVRSYWRLVCRLDDVADADSPPMDIGLRPVDIDADARAVHALNEATFAGNSDYRPKPFGTFCDEHLRAHDFDPGLSWVAEHRDAPVGFLLTRRWEQESVGFVDLLGVHPDHRGRGLATAMLSSAFVQFAAAGLREAQLGVASDNPHALRLYERCGMTPRFRRDTYERSAGRAYA